MELEEGLDPLARLGRDLRALERRLAARRPCRACAAGRSSSPRQVDRAQLDRRPGERPRPRRPSRRGRRAPAARRSRRAPRGAGRAPRRRRGGRGRRAPPAPPRPAAPSRQPGSAITQISLRPHLARGEQVLDLARHRLRLGALVARSARSLVTPWGSRQRSARGAISQSPSGCERRRNASIAAVARAPEPARRLGADRPAQARFPCAPTASSSARWAAPASSSSSTIRWRKRSATSAATSARSRSRLLELEDDVAAVEAAGLARIRSWRRRARRTRARARRARARPPSSRPAPRHRPVAQGRRRRPPRPSARRSGAAGGRAGRPGCRGSRGGAAAARRGGRAASPAARPARRVEEGVEPGLGRVLAQEPLGEPPRRCRPRAPRRGRRAATSARSRSRGAAARERRARARARGGPRARPSLEPPRQHLGLAGPGAPRTSSGPRRARRRARCHRSRS